MVPGPGIRKRTGATPTREKTTEYDRIGGSQGMSASHGDPTCTTRVTFTFGISTEFADAESTNTDAAPTAARRYRTILRAYLRAGACKRRGPAMSRPPGARS